MGPMKKTSEVDAISLEKKTMAEKLKNIMEIKTAREKRDKELDDLNALREILDAEEAEAKNSQMILENKKALFPAWSFDQMQNEVIGEPNLFWLEPKTSFDITNDVECQLDFPITPRAFLF
ncbi:unnamed protein product [Lactuca virosa]|uniref:Uncharacterized protein n=1 Tax=Lactuca virosa TaxID=75947 RepID=A0AAU9NN81_9ASTR|nr:unnamed protein product [Lactuca virosa]